MAFQHEKDGSSYIGPQQHDLRFFTMPLLAPCPHGFFTRRGGVSLGAFDGLNVSSSRGDSRENCIRNMALAGAALATVYGGSEGAGALPRHSASDGFTTVSVKTGASGDIIAPASRTLLMMHQVHGHRVSYATCDAPQTDPCDGLITDDPTGMICVITADCLPILLRNEAGTLVGAVHAGWRGLLNGVVQETVAEMTSRTSGPLFAAIGPSIQQKSYEVGPEVRDAFVRSSSAFAVFFKQIQETFLFDLPGAGVHVLSSCGVTVVSGGQDTYSNAPDFFSCRRRAHQGSPLFGCNLSVIGPRS